MAMKGNFERTRLDSRLFNLETSTGSSYDRVSLFNHAGLILHEI